MGTTSTEDLSPQSAVYAPAPEVFERLVGSAAFKAVGCSDPNDTQIHHRASAQEEERYAGPRQTV
jgi:hypothetical protein